MKPRMTIQHCGTYRLLQDYHIKSKYASIFRKGGVFEVTEINFRFKQVYVPAFGMWVNWSINCERIK